MSTTHDLKVWPEFFPLLLNGKKNFELRRNDRDFEAGDTIKLREWDPNTKDYTGRYCVRRVTYVLHGCGVRFIEPLKGGLGAGFVILSLGAI